MSSVCKSVSLCIPLAAMIVGGCRNEEAPPPIDLPETGSPSDLDQPRVLPEAAAAQLHPAQGSQAQGTVTFEPADGTVKVAVNLAGLAPGRHGLGAHSIVGRALVVHADADDLTSQPSGISGKPVACGIIGRE